MYFIDVSLITRCIECGLIHNTALSMPGQSRVFSYKNIDTIQSYSLPASVTPPLEHTSANQRCVRAGPSSAHACKHWGNEESMTSYRPSVFSAIPRGDFYQPFYRKVMTCNRFRAGCFQPDAFEKVVF